MEYDKTDFRKSFPEIIHFDIEYIIPQHMNDVKLKHKITNYLSKIEKWEDITYSNIEREFEVDKNLLFYSVGWKVLFQITPSLINLSYELYETGDTLTLCAESILTDINYENGDNSIGYSDWVCMFNASQKKQIIKFIDAMNRDPMGFFPDGFGMGAGHWRSFN